MHKNLLSYNYCIATADLTNYMKHIYCMEVLFTGGSEAHIQKSTGFV